MPIDFSSSVPFFHLFIHIFVHFISATVLALLLASKCCFGYCKSLWFVYYFQRAFVVVLWFRSSIFLGCRFTRNLLLYFCCLYWICIIAVFKVDNWHDSNTGLLLLLYIFISIFMFAFFVFVFDWLWNIIISGESIEIKLVSSVWSFYIGYRL